MYYLKCTRDLMMKLFELKINYLYKAGFFCEIWVLLWRVSWFMLDSRGAICIWRATHGTVFSAELCFWATKLVGESFSFCFWINGTWTHWELLFSLFFLWIHDPKTLTLNSNCFKRINASFVSGYWTNSLILEFSLSVHIAEKLLIFKEKYKWSIEFARELTESHFQITFCTLNHI